MSEKTSNRLILSVEEFGLLFTERGLTVTEAMLDENRVISAEETPVRKIGWYDRPHPLDIVEEGHVMYANTPSNEADLSIVTYKAAAQALRSQSEFIENRPQSFEPNLPLIDQVIQERFAHVIAEKVAEEREACARLCQNLASAWPHKGKQALLDGAAQIRRRGEPQHATGSFLIDESEHFREPADCLCQNFLRATGLPTRCHCGGRIHYQAIYGAEVFLCEKCGETR